MKEIIYSASILSRKALSDKTSLLDVLIAVRLYQDQVKYTLPHVTYQI